jgi:hypothetical protein
LAQSQFRGRDHDRQQQRVTHAGQKSRSRTRKHGRGETPLDDSDIEAFCHAYAKLVLRLKGIQVQNSVSSIEEVTDESV